MTTLIIDVGSSSVRAMLIDADLHIIDGATAHRAYHFDHQPEGASTIAADRLRQLTEACIDEVLAHPRAAEVRAVGMATFVGNLLGVDGQNRPLTPVYTYADVRCREDVAALRDEIDVRAAHQRTGCILHTAYLPGRLRWLERTQPDVCRDVNQWLDAATYLYRRWLDPAAPTSYSVASWSGLLNRESLTWDGAWLDALGLSRSKLPDLAEYTATRSGLRGDYRSRWPLLRDVPFYLAVGDGAAANVGSGGVGRDRPALTLGTTAALRIITDETLPAVPDGLWSYRVTATHHLSGGATSEGGNIFEWVRRTFALPDESAEAISSRLAANQPAAHGLVFLPLLAGERSPGWRSDATGTIHGLSLATTPADILQAALEGVACRLAVIADQLVDDGADVYASGGALVGSAVWPQIIADALNRPLHLLDEPEITARGVAALIAQMLEAAPPPAIKATITPEPSAVERLRATRERQQALYARLYGDPAKA